MLRSQLLAVIAAAAAMMNADAQMAPPTMPAPASHPAQHNTSNRTAPAVHATAYGASPRNTAPSLRAAPIQGNSPRIDGALDEPVWREAGVATGFVQLEPEPDSASSEETEVRVLYSRSAVYIGARLSERSGEQIRAPLARRDEDVPSDWFYVYLDTNGDGRTAVAFGVNPRGVKRDLQIDADGREDANWDAIWDAAVQIDDAGWTVEMRIPLNQLRFHAAGEEAEGNGWRVNFERRLSSRGEIVSWAPLPRARARKVAAYGALEGLEGIRPPPLRVELMPYTVARGTHAASEPGTTQELFGTFGADLQVGLGPSFTLTGTFNPDFGQVEADPAVVNVSGYRTFFPEKRPFFLEDRDLFEFNIGSTRIFHSRRIGRDGQTSVDTRSGLQAVPDASGILAASKLSGRTRNGWSVGLLHALTNAEFAMAEDSLQVEVLQPVEPQTNSLVARVQKTGSSGRSTVGTMFTGTLRGGAAELDIPVEAALVGGIDGWLRTAAGNHEFAAALLGSRVRGTADGMARIQTAHGRYFQRPDAEHLSYDAERTSLTGLAGQVSAAQVGPGIWRWRVGGHFLSPGFEANDLGYQREADLAHQYASFGYDHVGRQYIVRRHQLTINQWSDWSFGGERLATGGSADARLQFTNFWGVLGTFERHLPALSPDLLRGGPALATPGARRMRLVFNTDPRARVALRLDGSLLDEDETGARLRVLRTPLTVRPGTRTEVTLEPGVTERTGAVEYVTRRTTAGATHYMFGRVDQTTLSLATRVNLAVTPVLSLQFYAQPYMTARTLSDYMEVAEPRATRFADRFRVFSEAEVMEDPEAGRIAIDATGDGTADFDFPDPSFHYGQLSSNMVLRWEYFRGSTLYLVWSRDVRDRQPGGLDAPLRRLGELVGVTDRGRMPVTNVLALKLTVWLSP